MRQRSARKDDRLVTTRDMGLVSLAAVVVSLRAHCIHCSNPGGQMSLTGAHELI